MRLLGLAVSPGRCGTTALAGYLRGLGIPGLRVHHERVSEHQTLPGAWFRVFDAAGQARQAELPAVRTLLEEIDAHEGIWIDPGWTLYPLLPLLLARYGDRVRLLHMTRNPVESAASHAVKGLYDDTAEAEFHEDPESRLRPTSPRVRHPELAAAWDRMVPFERNLFRVAEIHALGLELHERHPEVPYLHVRLEELSSQALTDILEFYGLPRPESPPTLPRVNSTRRLARGARALPAGDWRKAADHPWALEVAERLGYDVSPEGLEGLAERMRRYERHGAVEHLAAMAYRIAPVRRAWRRWAVPWLYRRLASRGYEVRGRPGSARV